MNTFHFLLVEDHKKNIDDAKNRFSKSETIKLHLAKNYKEAKSIINDNFLHIALVDLNLEGEPGNNAYGQQVLEYLKYRRPSCRRILYTRFETEYVSHLYKLLDPKNLNLNGAINKNELQDYLHIVDHESKLWFDNLVDITNCEMLYSQLLEKQRLYKSSKEDEELPLITLDEIDFLISKLLGQGRATSESVNSSHRMSKRLEELDQIEELKRNVGLDHDDIVSISLTSLGGGKSSAVVAQGQPITRMGQKGILTVIKIAPRHDSEQEIERYEKYVRLLLPLDRRVEVFGTLLGDTLGAVCYSFAGDTSGSATTLASLIEKEEDQTIVFGYLRKLFDHEKQGWYAHRAQGRFLRGFFKLAYDLEAGEVAVKVFEFAKRIAPKVGATRQDNTILFGNFNLQPIRTILGNAYVTGDYSSCIVHGDLNPNNIIVSSEGDVIWIDFKDTVRGPISLDFAVLEANIRLSAKSLDRDLKSIVNDYSIEKQLWLQMWQSAEKPQEEFKWSNPQASCPYWATLDFELAKLMRLNFPDLDQGQHAATCLLIALRLFRIPKLDEDEEMNEKKKLRLIIWIAYLCNTLTEIK